MNSALIWIGLPIAAGAVLILLRRGAGPLSLIFALSLSLVLAWMAWQIPINTPSAVGPFTLQISPTFFVFGRSFTLANNDRVILTLAYMGLSFWLAGSFLAQAGRLFVPGALIVTGLLLAAFAVEPFLYAALLIATAVLVSIPMLAPPGSPAGQGVLRYIVFQMFSVPFLLFAGWLLSGVEASPGNLNLVLRAGVLLGLGFLFLIAIIPFHSWIPRLVAESHPYAATFLLLFLPTLALIFGLGFFDRYAWLRDRQAVFDLLIAIGSVTVVLGAFWAASQKRLSGVLAYAVVIGTGMSLQAIGLGGIQSVQLFFALVIPRGIALLVFAIALSAFRQVGHVDLDLDHFGYASSRHPLLTLALLLAIFSLAGFPLLAGFPAYWQLWQALSNVSALAAGASLFGSLGLGIAGLRLLVARIRRPGVVLPEETGDAFRDDAPGDLGNPYVWAYLLSSAAFLLLIGNFPDAIYGNLAGFLAVFPQMGP